MFSQSEGQSFCDGNPEANFFVFFTGKKYVVWQDTYYIEHAKSTKTLNKNEYVEFEQTWENGAVYQLYIREDDGTIFQYEDCCDEDTVRLPAEIKEGAIWQTADELSNYQILTTSGTLKTPFCEYKNLLVLKATFKNGVFNFYYQRGYGYIGCTVDGQLISYVSPRHPAKN